jgi:hypothetical protein
MLAIAIQSDAEKTDDFTLAFFRFLFRFTRHRCGSLPPKNSSTTQIKLYACA